MSQCSIRFIGLKPPNHPSKSATAIRTNKETNGIWAEPNGFLLFGQVLRPNDTSFSENSSKFLSDLLSSKSTRAKGRAMRRQCSQGFCGRAYDIPDTRPLKFWVRFQSSLYFAMERSVLMSAYSYESFRKITWFVLQLSICFHNDVGLLN